MFRTTARMLGAYYLNELSRLRRHPYRALLATSLLPDESDQLSSTACTFSKRIQIAYGGTQLEPRSVA